MEFDRIARELVLSNKAQLFPGSAGAVEILDVEVGPATFFQESRFGRWLKIHYSRDGLAASLKLWLKFCPDLDALFPVLADYDRQLNGQVFPRPYFACHLPDSGSAVLATAFISGTLLRDRFRRLAFTRQIARLEPIFRSNGAKMRQFHDASAGAQTISVDEIADAVAARARSSEHLSSDERNRVSAHIARWRGTLSVTALPAIRTHNDWVLRNIMIAPDGADYVIDTDDMRARRNWRWHDVVLFLLDIETQLKWFPLTTRPMLSRLWRAFWDGYTGERGFPDEVNPAQLPAILYLVRLHWLLDGVVHQPHFEILLDGRLRNRRVRGWLKKGVVEGRYTLLDFRCET